MNQRGYMEDVYVTITPRVQNGSSWIFPAARLSYEVTPSNETILRIVNTRQEVKVEPTEGDEKRSPRNKRRNSSDIEEDSRSRITTPLHKWKSQQAVVIEQSTDIVQEQPQDALTTQTADALSLSSSSSAARDATMPPSDKKSETRSSAKRTQPCSIKKHGSIKKSTCEVVGCSSYFRGHARIVDAFGPPGRRCRRHGGSAHCNVENCCKTSRGVLRVADSSGEPGPRCKAHGGCARTNDADIGKRKQKSRARRMTFRKVDE
eukprot:GEMP01068671.1.p1 GENE.GEMP01068671.1~~GEMP01068671.1.p1  ORF type:complete len:262 (+),score=65.14 GEMP01068671.1:118-903(+)